MSEKDILEIVRNPERLGLLADEFRGGRDPHDLLDLLNASHDEIVSAGAWIAGEIFIEPADAEPLIPRLLQLVSHDDPSIRFTAIGALFPFLDIADPDTKEMLIGLTRDPNEGVRTISQAALKRLSERQSNQGLPLTDLP